jgi:hypothetical protein
MQREWILRETNGEKMKREQKMPKTITMQGMHP